MLLILGLLAIRYLGVLPSVRPGRQGPHQNIRSLCPGSIQSLLRFLLGLSLGSEL